MDYRKVNFGQLLVLIFLLNFIVQATHEAGHWIIYEALGKEPVWSFTRVVQIWDTPPLHPEEWVETVAPNGDRGWLRYASAPSRMEDIVGLAGGPLASLLSVIVGLGLMQRSHNPITQRMGLILALIGSLIMGQYYLRGAMRTGGDEYFIASYLGIPKFLLDIPLGLAFITGFIVGMWDLGDWRTRFQWLGALVVGSLTAGLFLVTADEIVQTQINEGNALFQPLAGYALPVLIINVTVLIVCGIWWKRASDLYSAS